MSHTLLLADDSVTIQRVIALTFAEEDVQVVAAGDGDKALALLNESPPDVVLADVDMPGMTGLDLARHIKATPRLAHIPVLLLAGAFDPVEPDEANAAGCAGVLAKPFDPQVLVTRVRELLSGQHPREVPASTPAVAVIATEAPETPAETETPALADAPARSHVDEYLEELDAALAAAARTERLKPVRPEPGDDDPPPASDWLKSPARPGVATPAPTSTSPLSAGPSLAEAFAALLDAERAGARTAPSAPPELDEAVEAAVRRVLERLSERMVRDMASDILTRVAERMVREEIDRIRRETP